ncbi:hypothetical protein BDN70DRAFT_938407 [Pholiota conissans]|uniref:Ams2/SPT21 N-terminal domain-containing protein n=1 Tax=Pholiota conissans TaxID=109636 RepID=A0A9P5YNE4_9AGAR|nr:hypothetical protein BDN70DRAFT_938407 [Pholiota conissans]
MVEKKTTLRVLYTINSSPQYILARSHIRVPISVIPSNESTSNVGSSNASQHSDPLYANVLLKTCLDTICRSSPELTHDSTRDFSLYVLDPLESNSAPAPVHINNANGESSSKGNSRAVEQPRGVAVGLGLMSWALAADDSDAMFVVGTLVKQSNGQEALEVIFALRETMAMKRPAWSMPPPSLPSSSQETAASSLVDANSLQHDSKSQLWSSNQPLASSSTGRPPINDLTKETLASIQMRAKAKIKPPKPVRQSTVPVTESDKLMNADTFIGPMKKKGRPKMANAAVSSGANAVASSSSSVSSPQEVIVIDGSDSDGTQPTPTTSSFQPRPTTNVPAPKSGVQDLTKKKKMSYSQYPTTPAFTKEPLIRRVSEPVTAPSPAPVKTEPQEEQSNILDILSYFSTASSADPAAQNAAILSALCTIDSQNSQINSQPSVPANPALVSALKQLLVMYANAAPASSFPTTPSSSQPQHLAYPHSASSQDDIVVLDKENVNPKVFQKSNGKDASSVKGSDSSQTSPRSQENATAGPSSHSKPVQSLGLSMRSNEIQGSRPSLKESILSSGSERVVRKRTLSDFMDEKEFGRSKGKGKERERERIEKRDGHRHSSSSQRSSKSTANDALRHYPRLLASNQPRSEQPSNYYRTPLESMSMTSPARPQREGNEPFLRQQEVASGSSSSQPASRSTSPKPRISASSPVRGPHQERKKYVVPAWARTSTSTQPRLSEEAQKALEEQEEKKKRERAAARKRLPSMQAKSKSKGAASSSAKSSGSSSGQENKVTTAPVPPKKPEPVRAPIVSSDGPMIAAANIAFPFMSARSSSPPPNPVGLPQTPKTPTRERYHLRPTPGQENDSLFTPIMRSGSIFGSASSRSTRTPLMPSVLTSPLGNRKKAKISSPTRSMLTGKTFSTPNSRKRSSFQSSEDSIKPSDDKEDEVPQSLEKELEDAMEDLDCPPSSLPIASSDIDVEEAHTSADIEIPGEEDTETSPVKQHWQGLPPSSPPAPSSPMLLPETTDDDEEMDEIPIATSDSETDMAMTPSDSDATADSPADFTDPLDYSSFFTGGDLAPNSIMDIFDQFTHLSSDSDAYPSMVESTESDIESVFQNGLEGIDFTEFWETFKPMVNNNAQVALQEENSGEDAAVSDTGKEGVLPQLDGIDHVKLADEMQALLSGCLM